MERYRITRDNSVYYVTFTVIDWLPLFVREETCRIVADSLNFCVRNKGLLVGAYVVMPTSLCAGLLTPHAMRPEVSNHFLRNDLIWSATGSPETTQSTTSRAVYRELHSRYDGSSDGFGNKIPETPRNLGLRMSGPLRGGKDSCMNDEQPTRLTSYLPWLIAGQMVAGFILVIAFLATKGVIADSSRKWLVMWVPVCWLMVPLTIGFYWDITPARTRVAWLLIGAALLGNAVVSLVKAGFSVGAWQGGLRRAVVELLVIGCFCAARAVRRLRKP